MKFLILIAVILAVLWLARSLRKPLQPPEAPKPSPPPPPQAGDKLGREEMVACAQCGVHLPSSEALPGRGGMFCSEAHRGAFESQRSR